MLLMAMGISFYLIPIITKYHSSKLEMALHILLCKVSQSPPFSTKSHKYLNTIMMRHLIFEIACQQTQKRN